jgi:hypothetical protein
LPAAFDFVRVGLPQFQTGDLGLIWVPHFSRPLREGLPWSEVEGWGRHTPMFTFELHFFLVLSYRRGMIELEEALREAMSADEILMRFKKLFGREMTAKERDLFFLSPEPPRQNRN